MENSSAKYPIFPLFILHIQCLLRAWRPMATGRDVCFQDKSRGKIFFTSLFLDPYFFEIVWDGLILIWFGLMTIFSFAVKLCFVIIICFHVTDTSAVEFSQFKRNQKLTFSVNNSSHVYTFSVVFHVSNFINKANSVFVLASIINRIRLRFQQ